ncbi:MAG: NAD-dependent epimerase/dehydratase family protein [Flavisolibacter sp.]
MSNRILITGATGFIGSFLVEEALSRGFEVIAGIRASSSKKYLEQLDIDYAVLDLSDPEKLKQQLQDLQQSLPFSYVIHNAGITQESRTDSFIRSNYHYTRHLAQAAGHAAGDLKKFVLVSSLAAYGPGALQPMIPIRCSDEKRPMTDYGRSKMLAEQYVSAQDKFPYLVVNPTAVYGPRDRGFLPFFKMITRGLEGYVGKAGQQTSMIYVKDLARAIVSLAGSEAENRSFFVSDGEAYAKEFLGETARKILQKKTFRLHLPLPAVKATVGVTDRVHRLFRGYQPFLNREKLNEISQPNWLCDSSETWQTINDTPRYLVEEGFRETIEWYKKEKWL